MNRLPYNLSKFICMCFLTVVILNMASNTKAGNLTASTYEINLSFTYPQKLISEIIKIERNDKENFTNQKVYIERFKLKNEDDKEIAAANIVIETPYYKDDLESTYRFLLMKKEQFKSWFKLELLPGVAYMKPGKYTGVIKIDGLEWEMVVQVEVLPFVTFALDHNNLNIKIDNPTKSNFYVAPELCRLNINCNHNDWEIQMSLYEEKLTAGVGHEIQQKQIYYRLEETFLESQSNIIINSEKNFIKMKEDCSSLLLNGTNYSRGLTGVRFGINLGKDWTQQPAGEYKGAVILTLRQLFD